MRVLPLHSPPPRAPAQICGQEMCQKQKYTCKSVVGSIPQRNPGDPAAGHCKRVLKGLGAIAEHCG
eukprot:13243848-Heterocapsa_arctica.AAC.1